MKTFPFIFYLMIIIFSYPALATNYYLSNNGNNLSSGTSPADPWQTISQLNTAILLPGDSIFFLSGDIFNGQIVIASGGNESAYLYFGTYDGTEPAIIAGADAVMNWNSVTGNIYHAPLTKTPAHLFMNNVQMTIARFPNSGFQIHQGGTGNTGFVDSALGQPDEYWNGATIRMRTSDRKYETGIVSSFSNSTITFQNSTSNNIENGYGYYFDNLLSELDTAGEWYYDAANQLVYVYATADPNLSTIEASVYDDGLTIQNGSSFIVIKDLRFEKQRRNGINLTENSSFIQISRCSFFRQGERGISITNGATDCLVQQNEFTDINGQGIGDNNLLRVSIHNNTFKRINMFPGYGLDEPNNGYAMVCGISDSINVSSNRIDSTGSGGIFCGAFNSVFRENVIRNTLITMNDLGAIYCYGPQGSHSEFINNIILFCHSSNEGTPANEIKNAGIYLDEAFMESEVINNTITDALHGIWIRDGSSKNNISGNLIYGCSKSQLMLQEGYVEGATVENKVHGNIFYALSESQELVLLSSSFESFNPVALDSNYYFNPYNFYAIRMDIAPGLSEFPKFFTLPQWQNATLSDYNSHATYFFWNRYHVAETLGEELIDNGKFSNNFDGWDIGQEDSIFMALDNSTPLDFGCLKLIATVEDPASAGNVFHNGFELDSGKYYRLNLSNYSIKKGNVAVKLKETSGIFAFVSSPRFFPFESFRLNYEIVLTVSDSCTPCRIDLQLYGSDSLVWIDNVSLIPVSVFYNDPRKKSRLFINESSVEKTINLQDSIFFDLDQQVITQQIILAPYSSAVLVFDSALISSDQQFPETLFKTQLFPNPTAAGNTLHISNVIKSEARGHLKLFNLTGELIDEGFIYPYTSDINYKLPKNIPAGIYVLKILSGATAYTYRIVVSE